VGTRADLRQKRERYSFSQQLLELGGFESPQALPHPVVARPGSVDIRLVDFQMIKAATTTFSLFDFLTFFNNFVSITRIFDGHHWQGLAR